MASQSIIMAATCHCVHRGLQSGGFWFCNLAVKTKQSSWRSGAFFFFCVEIKKKTPFFSHRAKSGRTSVVTSIQDKSDPVLEHKLRNF
jgi:hypothetical protein